MDIKIERLVCLHFLLEKANIARTGKAKKLRRKTSVKALTPSA
jgi:hypothetical protein